MNEVKIKRKTRETDVTLSFIRAGEGKTKIATGVGFFDHMLELFAFHGCFDLDVTCKGDLEVCAHHSVEDVGIVLGQAIAQSLPKEGRIVRFASALVPMDESLARVAVDVSGRPCLVFDADLGQSQVGNFDTELVQEFFQAFVNNAKITLHLSVLYGSNTHHKIEALFKGTGIALRQALVPDSSRLGASSTKGIT